MTFAVGLAVVVVGGTGRYEWQTGCPVESRTADGIVGCAVDRGDPSPASRPNSDPGSPPQNNDVPNKKSKMHHPKPTGK
jgi:hypothetical protein